MAPAQSSYRKILKIRRPKKLVETKTKNYLKSKEEKYIIYVYVIRIHNTYT